MSSPSLAAALALLAAAASCAPIIPTPPPQVLAQAWQGIADPQLKAQLPPAGPFGPADCVVHLGAYSPLATPEQRKAIDRASKAWRQVLVSEGEGDEAYADQMIASSVNPLADTPPALRQAAAAWCVGHVPQM